MAKISFIDTSIRDGNQSLWGATGLHTGMILEIAPLLDKAGFEAIDFTTSTHMAVTARYHKEDPWERIRLVRKAMPDTPLGFLSTGMRFISWEQASEELMRLSFRLLVNNGIRRFWLMDPMNDAAAVSKVARMVREEGGESIVGALVYTESPIHDDEYYADKAEQLAASSVFDKVYLKDPGGLLRPERAKTIIPAIQARLGGLALELHSHCTIGLAPFSYIEAAKADISTLHVAATPLANGSSQPAVLSTLSNLRELGHEFDMDEKVLQTINDYYLDLAQAEGLEVGVPQEFDLSLFRHQVPGGMISTMLRQLKEINQQHRLPEVLKEIEKVREELGYPIMVTPFSQVVGTQAVMNVVSGAERYANVPDEVIRYVIGRFGTPPAPLEPDVLDRIEALPRTKELRAEPMMLPLEELRAKIGRQYSDEEFLLRAVMPAEQINMMGPCRRSYAPAGSSIKTLLKEIAARPAVSCLRIEKDDFRLELKSRQQAMKS